MFLKFLVNLPRPQKRVVSLFVDSIFIIVAFWLAFLLRLDSTAVLKNNHTWILLAAVLPLSLLSFVKLGLYRAVLRYMNMQAMWAIIAGVMLSTVYLTVLSFFLSAPVPRTVPFIYASFCILFVGGARLAVRAVVGQITMRRKEGVIIYGAGSAGRQLATALANGPEYSPVAFIDDDPKKHLSLIQGVCVHPPSQISEIAKQKCVNKILLALPSVSRSRRKEVLNAIEKFKLQVMTIPGMADIVSGTTNLDEVKNVEIDDLLGRDSVQPRQDLMSANIENKIVMVTGAGGSIGSELCRQIIKNNPTKIVLFELSEFALYAIEKELSEYRTTNGLNIEVIPILGSIQNKKLVESTFSTFKVKTVYHAAAYKHVPLVEHNVVEGVRNNIYGTYNVATAAINAKVDTFVLISTDKAVRPTNIMGTTKRMAELVLQGLSDIQSSTRFTMVRFGNVLGSSGSVVPLFRKQIKAGGPITLTHQDITRYFMTIPEAAQLVIQAGAMGVGSDVFVLDMGEPVKIKDLATKMVHLSGLEVKHEKRPNGDIEIKCTGLRPGEKLFEELLIGDNVIGTDHPRILSAQEIKMPWHELEPFLGKLKAACDDSDHILIRKLLLQAPTAFAPTDGICDLNWQEKQSSQTNVTALPNVSGS
ncbi:polysaccharide biosynthesis protein [Pseudoalteromonas distincta]|uniref:Polysaccharide biosynthesis protein n=1 Tax=Pseudoalteromonas distincta TaxID=77608 RepID=A0A4P9IYF4_9GAMM|nr:nucleoside-diphosphate sugar epimerase/dehydratase [Pseudoalteromonas distincta]KAA1162939.1 polysaccharide biosynthesis protein [Pseudoalteromonas distincta]QCU73128.1 polysaccharide biosynthesis protein [Pseudoalteromonas distincta]